MISAIKKKTKIIFNIEKIRQNSHPHNLSLLGRESQMLGFLDTSLIYFKGKIYNH
jgi:hypothetical protein